MNKLAIRIGLIQTIIMMLPFSAMALSTDKNQPIHIESDSLMIDEPAGISTYQGNVRYRQGSISMVANELVVYGEEGELQRLEAFGKPVKYHQLLDSEDEELHAEALTIKYFADTGKVFLEGSAILTRGDNEFTGNKIVYDSIQEVVSAHKAETGEERVQVIIQPRQQPKDSPEAATVEGQ